MGWGSLQSERKTRAGRRGGGLESLGRGFQLIKCSLRASSWIQPHTGPWSTGQNSAVVWCDGNGQSEALGTGSLLVLVYVKGREDLFWLTAKVSIVLGKGSGRSGHEEEQSGVPHKFHAVLSFQF